MARRSAYRSSGPRAGSVLLGGPSPARRRRRRGRRVSYGPRRGFDGGRWLRRLAAAAVLALLGAGAYLYVARTQARDARHAAAQRFAEAWRRGDEGAMWRALSPAARRAHPEAAFAADYARANRAARVTRVLPGRAGKEHGGRIAVPVRVRTADFGTLRGTVALPVSGSGDRAGVDWDPALRLPGLRPGETPRRVAGRTPARGELLAANGSPLAATPSGASIAGTPPPKATGLERIYDRRLGGHPAERLEFGDRVVARVAVVRGRDVRTFFKPGLSQVAEEALGGKLGGVAVIRPRDGAVQALAGLAVSAPQPPGSTFKIITLAAALQHGVATPSSSYPVRTYALLSGTKLSNASGEACGGSLTHSFSESCNSVFAPLGAKLGAKRLVAAAEAFGFNEAPRLPAAKPSTIAPPRKLPDDLAVGAAAIGQDRDLATPLGMASVGATIAADGRRARPRIARMDRVIRRRAVPARVAHQVRSMMLAVVGSGTGTAAALPGVQVAGKTGTAELRPNSKDPRDADAWFVAFAPAERPQVAVAVMLVGAGFGGTAAAPVARRVLAAALG